MVPRIDLAGTVEASSHPGFKAGDAVLLNGWGVGEVHWGGAGQRARLRATGWCRCPPPSAGQAMAIGTAGYTAMLCVLALEKHGVTPDQEKSSSPAPPAASAAWRWRFSPNWAIASWRPGPGGGGRPLRN